MTLNQAETIPSNVMTVFDAIAFIASLSSLILSVVTIFIAFHFKRESDQVNRETRNLLIDIKTDAKAISQVVMPELRAYGEAARGFMFHANKMESGESTIGGEKYTSSTSEESPIEAKVSIEKADPKSS